MSNISSLQNAKINQLVPLDNYKAALNFCLTQVFNFVNVIMLNS